MRSDKKTGTFWSNLPIPIVPSFISNIQIPGSILKWIAIVTMFMDHFAVAVMEPLIRMQTFPYRQEIYKLHNFFRNVGRSGFPLFCFLLVEGLLHTRNRPKYAIRLLLFGLLSEVPFDIALFGSWCTWDHQNVYFTLLIGYLAIWAVDEVLQRTRHVVFINIAIPAIILAAFFLAERMHTDYHGYGVLTIVLMYLFRFNHLASLLAGLIMLCGYNRLELPALYTLISVSFYNGTRGRQPKYFFYAFYPVHLMLLYFLSLLPPFFW